MGLAMDDTMPESLIERPDRLQLYPCDDLVKRIPAPWQVKGVLREQSVTLLYGKRGCYKSFLALDLGASLATGQPWHGHPILSPGLVVYIAAEGGGGMVQRARAWAEQHNIHPIKINMRFVTEPVIVTATSEDIDVLIYRIRQAIDWHDVGWFDEETGIDYDHETAREWPKLIVIDTLARCFIGNENQQEDMGQFVQGVDRLKIAFNASVLIIHHTGKDGKSERGSTALGGACDTIYRLDVETEGILLLTNEKMKDSREPSPLALSYREVKVKKGLRDDSDEDLTSVIIEDAPKARTALDTLAILVEQGPLSWKAWLEGSGLPKSTFRRHILDLERKGKISKGNDVYEAV